VKFNPSRADNMIIQSIALLDQMDKDINTFAMRVREWYSWHFPELKEIVKDNFAYARCAAFIKVILFVVMYVFFGLTDEYKHP
jgi:nucleolar protein 56